MSRIFINSNEKKIVLISYAGGTKYFKRLAESNTIAFKTARALDVQLIHKTFDVIQIVRDPVARYMSWFDKQYVYPKFRKASNISFNEWANNTYTIQWFDEYFEQTKYRIHYDGHTNFQSIWPTTQFKHIQLTKWSYLKMEDIDSYFLNKKKFTPIRDPKEYIGIWDTLDFSVKEHAITQIQNIYKPDIEWYNSLTFI